VFVAIISTAYLVYRAGDFGRGLGPRGGPPESDPTDAPKAARRPRKLIVERLRAVVAGAADAGCRRRAARCDREHVRHLRRREMLQSPDDGRRVAPSRVRAFPAESVSRPFAKTT